jgi:RNA polymerase sigma factor (sigma-70 family)
MSKSSNQENIPRLPKRLNNSDIFCTYLILKTDNCQENFQWKNDSHLNRNFELYQKNNEAFAQLCFQPNGITNILEFWKTIALDASPIVQQWERQNRKQLALHHLMSYLETSCYYATKKVSSISKIRSWEDYLSSARIFIHNSDNLVKLLKSYDDSQALLDTYIQGILIKEIQNQQNICKFSPWRMLVKTSEKLLREALQIYGHKEPYISQYIFARKHFKPVYNLNKVENPALRKSGDKWLEPDSEDFQAAANCYNAEKFLSSAPHEVSAGLSISTEQMQAWMKICISSIQKYAQFTQDSEEFLAVTHPEDINFEAEESDSESNSQFEETQSAFHKELDRFKPDQHKILLLYYGAGLKQKQLEIKLGTSQSAISRRLLTIKNQLLKTMIQKSQPEKWVTNYVVEWLHKDFRAPRHSDLIEAALVQATKELDSKDQQVLFLRYGEQVNEQNIATHLGISLFEVNAIIAVSHQKLQAYLIKELPHWEKECVEEWLKSFYHSKISAACQTLNLSLDSEDTSQIIDKIVEECLQNLIVTKKGE